MAEFELERIEGCRAVLCGLHTEGTDEDFEHAMGELALLADTCGFETVLSVTQNARTPERATYIGSGKLEELKAAASELEADLVIFDGSLSPMQFRNLSKILSRPVLDRTGLILRIFSEQARTREARLQVEHANLQYIMPRLAGMWTHFGRQAGASGSMSNRGIGETQLELDRRHIERRIAELEKELKKVDRERAAQRGKRLSSDLPKVSLVGYTNAGKSTIMNALLSRSAQPEEKKVLEKDALFATLDTTVRRIRIGERHPFLLSDTVGFIEELPHSLIKAFRSTLEEVRYADLLIQVIDFSDPMYETCRKVTDDTLREIGAGSVPRLYVFNKTDLAEPLPFPVPVRRGDYIYLSAKTGSGIELLLDAIEELLTEEYREEMLLLPYARGDLLQKLLDRGDVRKADVRYEEDGIRIRARLSAADADKLRSYLC